MPRGYAPSKKDSSQPAIEAAFRQAGWAIEDVHIVGGGFDLFVAKHGHTIAIECKSDKKKLTPAQLEKQAAWQGDYLWGSDPVLLLQMAEIKLARRER